jgi:hypothetical protein
MADTPIDPPPPQRRSGRGFVVITSLVSVVVAVSLTVLIINHFPTNKRGIDLREEIPRMQAVIDFESVASWVMGCMGVASYEVLPLWYQELLSYYKIDNVTVDKLTKQRKVFL